MKKIYLALMLLIAFRFAHSQSQVVTTGNNVINTSNPYAADVVIGSDAAGGARHDASIMWWSSGSASRIWNSGDVFYLSQWSTTNANIGLAAGVGGYSYFQGNLGIGTTSPAYKLDVANNLRIGAQGGKDFTLINGGAGVGSQISMFYADGAENIRLAGNNDSWLNANHGNVGIGTINATQKLTINGGGIGFDWNSTDKKLYSPADGDLEWYTHNGAGVHGFAVSHQGTKMVYLNTNGNSYFNGGNLGIGTTTPKANLQVIGTFLTNGNDSNLDGRDLSYLTGSAQMLIGWNRLGGYGETDFISNQGLGSMGGFSFRNYNNAGAENQLMWIRGDGNVAIGTIDPKGYKLAVAGNAIAESMTVKLQSAWGDYVFKPQYNLMPLSEVKTYIDKNQHLSEIPSAAEIEKNGINLGEMNKVLVKKVEELTLYLIEKDKQVNNLNKKLQDQEEQLKRIQAQVDSISNK